MTEQTAEREVQVGWRIPESMRWRVRELALQRRVPAQDVARKALQRYLEEAERETAKDRRARLQRERAEREARP